MPWVSTTISIVLLVISVLVYRDYTAMPSLSTVRTFNAAFAPSYTPVAIFVGGTSGIGQGMAEAFARHTKGNAHIVIVGRNRAAAEAIISRFPKPTADVKHEFVECDITLMKNVQRVSQELLVRIPKINFLALTAGVLTMNGRNETEEGIDRKLAVHYYGRWKFIQELLPAVKEAQKSGEDAKVISVLAAGKGAEIDLEDLGLKKTFSLAKAALQAPTYNDLMMQEFATNDPDVSFVHGYPGTVNTGLAKASDSALLRGVTYLMPLLSPFMFSQEASGEHQLYALLKASRGFMRTNERGDDMGMKRFFGSEEARKKLWNHTLKETTVQTA